MSRWLNHFFLQKSVEFNHSRIKIFRQKGAEGDELYVEQLAGTDEAIYECPPRDVAPFFLPSPILVRANVWHTISVKIRYSLLINEVEL